MELEYACFLFDVRDRKTAAEALASLPDEWKAIDILINNAGLVIGVDKEHEGNLDEWDIVIDTNIKSLLAMTRLVVPGMVARGRGHIINIGSIAGDAAYAGGSVYCATKAAVKALSDGLRIDLVDTPLRVTNIKPGLVETNFSVVRFRGDKDKADNVYKGIRPLTGDDIAETVYFAASVPEYMQIAEMLVMPTYQATEPLFPAINHKKLRYELFLSERRLLQKEAAFVHSRLPFTLKINYNSIIRDWRAPTVIFRVRSIFLPLTKFFSAF